MSARTDAAAWLRLQQDAGRLAPDISKAILAAFDELRTVLPEGAITRLIAGGGSERLVSALLDGATLDAAFQGVRDELTTAVVRSANVARRAMALPKENGLVAGFGVLNPRVIDAIQNLEGAVINKLKEEVRDTVRMHVAAGLEAGISPRQVARDLRAVIGMAPNQVRAVANFRKMLTEGNVEARTRELRDRRFDTVLARALGPGGTGLTPAQIDKMSFAYEKRMIAFNAETNARTAALQANKEAQYANRRDAIDKGYLDRHLERKRWAGVLDARERAEHVKMEGEGADGSVPFDAEYSNTEVVPGSKTFNCRCISIYFTAKSAGAGLAGTKPPPAVAEAAAAPAVAAYAGTPPPTAITPTGSRGPARPAFTSVAEGLKYLQDNYVGSRGFPGTSRGMAGGMFLKGFNLAEVEQIAEGFDQVLGPLNITVDGIGGHRAKSAAGYYRRVDFYSRTQGYAPVRTRYDNITFDTQYSKKSIANDPRKLSENYENYRAYKIRQVQEKIDYAKMSGAPHLLKNVPRLERDIELLKTPPSFGVGNRVERGLAATAAHEAAHAAYYQTPGTEATWTAGWAKISRLDWLRVSEYAGKNAQEAFAETATRFACGLEKDLPIGVFALFLDVFEGIVNFRRVNKLL